MSIVSPEFQGRVYQVISPDTGTTTYSYDPADNLTSKTDAKGVTISYQYDALNRLTKIDFPSDTDIIYAYDSCVNGKGHLCSMTDASGTTVYEYSAKGQIKKETKTIDSVQYVTQYTYDMDGNMTTMTYPSGRVITYNYINDRAASVLNGAANLATNITYKPFGGMSGITYGNGIAGTIGYDNQYRITAISTGSVLNLSYSGYDNNGNITGITNNLDNTKNKAFTYDTLDRLSTATSTGIWGSLAWTYDGVGNRLTENSNSYTYAANTNKLNSANGLSYGYDSNGNTTSQAARSYTYNQNQRLIQVVDGSTSAGYTYNGNGQRVKKNVNGTITVFHYSTSGQIIAESDSSGNITAEYVYLNSQPLAKIDATGTYYYHNDHLSTPQKITDGSGAVVWSADYKPFGEVTITVNTITNNLRFPGQYFDAETGFNYNYFRDYNPVIGRYVQADPAGIQGGANPLYGYVSQNPLGFIDPLGLFCIPLPSRTGPWITYGSTSERIVLAQVMFADLTGPRGICIWKKYRDNLQKRVIIPREFCCEKRGCPPSSSWSCFIKEGREKIEYRTKTEQVDVTRTPAIRYFAGNDIEEGDRWCCNNPYTGETICGNM